MSDTALDDHRNVGDGERIASGLGGAALILYAALRPSLLGAALAAGGALLVERAVTGQCRLYGALSVSTRERAPDATQDEGKRGTSVHHDAIDRASDDSFPASDPPSWSPHRAGSPAIG
jgi:hypothetical protein